MIANVNFDYTYSVPGPFKVVWWNRGQKHNESDLFEDVGEAINFGSTLHGSFRYIRVHADHGGVNKGKFFLHLIIK